MDCKTGRDPVLELVRALDWHAAPEPQRSVAVASLGTPAINLTFGPLPTEPPALEQANKALQAFFSDATVKELARVEPEVMARLASESAVAVHLLTDPVSTLSKLQITLSHRALNEIQAMRRALITPETLEVLKEVKQVSLKVNHTGGTL